MEGRGGIFQAEPSKAENDRQVHSGDPCFGPEIDANSREKHQQISVGGCEENRLHALGMTDGADKSAAASVQSR